ncbi:MAG: Sir2 family NAD-dependent protein deacetylase [Bacteroidales bacterium]|nr:Sir2 family NAD-dependent protein deacetylase [Bacteroidales bacterium]
MKKVIILTGAGISAESGISTFRDSDGLWEHHRVEEVCTYEAYVNNPGLVLDFYNQRRAELHKAKPNEAHRQLVRLEESYDVRIITQNVDNLHEQAGSKCVLHLHGEMTKARSDRNHYTTPAEGRETIDIGYRPIRLGEKAPDGAQLRPHIVWFGEAVPNISLASEWCEEADYFVVVGTSMAVYPAAGLIAYVPRKVPCYLVDPKAVSVSRPIKIFQEKAGTGVKKVVDELLGMEQQ